MSLSCCIWALSGSEEEVLVRTAELGFTWIDIRPFAFAGKASRNRMRELGLQVSCVALSAGMPDGAALDSSDKEQVSVAMEYMDRALKYSVDLGASAVYVVPGTDADDATLARYAERLAEVATRAADVGLTLCVEHFPGKALPTVTGTLEFLDEIDHPNLYLLFDIGHAQMSGEDPTEAITRAGNRLGYVHLDDNDGVGDLHLGLTDGVLTEAALRQMFFALDGIGYDGPISLELNSNLPDPSAALKQSREIVSRCKSL